MKKVALRLGAGALMVAGTFGIAGAASASGGNVIKVEIQDRCDPATFNALPPAGLGPGACAPFKERGGTTTFGDLLASLDPVAHTGSGAWRYTRTAFSLKPGDRIRVTNVGGEGHSFTEVPFFGGGCVDPLNQLTGLTTVAATCPDDFATVQGPGQSRENCRGRPPSMYSPAAAKSTVSCWRVSRRMASHRRSSVRTKPSCGACIWTSSARSRRRRTCAASLPIRGRTSATG